MAQMTGFKVYKGTKDTFISSGKAAANTGAIVFITGGDDASKSCIFAQGTYFANFSEFIAAYIGALNYVKGINVGGKSYNAAAGGGYVAFNAKDNNSTVTVNVTEDGVVIGLHDDFVNKVNNTAIDLGGKSDAADKDGSAFARIANLAALVSDLTGGETTSIAGQITAAINDLRTEIVGTLDAEDAKTLAAINDELNGLDIKVKAIADDYLKTADKTELANRITNEAPVTIAESAGTGDVLKTYTFTQNGKEIGKINLAKDVVVTSGAVVLHDGVKCLELTLTSGDVVHIPVTDLVDVYTAKAGADKVQVAISDSNEISASIVAGAVTVSELADNAVETAKIADKNVTKAKLADDVQTSLGKADSSVQEVEVVSGEDVMDAYITGSKLTVKLSLTHEIPSAGHRHTDSVPSTKAIADYVDSMWEWEEL